MGRTMSMVWHVTHHQVGAMPMASWCMNARQTQNLAVASKHTKRGKQTAKNKWEGGTTVSAGGWTGVVVTSTSGSRAHGTVKPAFALVTCTTIPMQSCQTLSLKRSMKLSAPRYRTPVCTMSGRTGVAGCKQLHNTINACSAQPITRLLYTESAMACGKKPNTQYIL